jgi:hypothetical protein
MLEEPSFVFDYPKNTLKEILLKHFMKKTANWMIDKNNNLICMNENSYWEAAASIEFLSELSIYLEPSDPLNKNIKDTCLNTFNWLKSEKNKTIDGLINWDGNTWDTSVILRAFLIAIEKYKNCFSTKECNELNEILINSSTWILLRFYKWEKEVKYPFGDADIAQILITLSSILRHNPNLFLDIENKIRVSSEIKKKYQTLHDITQYLISKRSLFQNVEETCFWEDFFQTAEILEALVAYYLLVKDKKIEPIIGMKDLKDIIIKTLHTIEIGQVNGMWGMIPDTCHTLASYIKCSKTMAIEPEVHIVFKALRWICDEKQVFNDGSFQHSYFLTVFYSIAVQQVYQNWSYANKNILDIYDDVVWYLVASSTTERRYRLQAEKRIEDTTEELTKINSRVIIFKKAFLSSIWSIAIFIIPVLYVYINRDKNFLSLELITLLFTLYFAGLGIIWTYEKYMRRFINEYK